MNGRTQATAERRKCLMRRRKVSAQTVLTAQNSGHQETENPPESARAPDLLILNHRLATRVARGGRSGNVAATEPLMVREEGKIQATEAATQNRSETATAKDLRMDLTGEKTRAKEAENQDRSENVRAKDHLSAEAEETVVQAGDAASDLMRRNHLETPEETGTEADQDQQKIVPLKGAKTRAKEETEDRQESAPTSGNLLERLNADTTTAKTGTGALKRG